MYSFPGCACHSISLSSLQTVQYGFRVVCFGRRCGNLCESPEPEEQRGDEHNKKGCRLSICGVVFETQRVCGKRFDSFVVFACLSTVLLRQGCGSRQRHARGTVLSFGACDHWCRQAINKIFNNIPLLLGLTKQFLAGTLCCLRGACYRVVVIECLFFYDLLARSRCFVSESRFFDFTESIANWVCLSLPFGRLLHAQLTEHRPRCITESTCAVCE